MTENTLYSQAERNCPAQATNSKRLISRSYAEAIVKKASLAGLIVSLLLLCSCGKDKETGSISEISVRDAASDKLAGSFYAEERPLSYTYKDLPLPNLSCALKIPKNWTVKVNNVRYLSLFSPEDDEALSSCTFNIVVAFGPFEKTEGISPSVFSLFNDDFEGIGFKIRGQSGLFHESYLQYDSLKSLIALSDAPFPSLIAEYENAYLEDRLGNKAESINYTALHGYARTGSNAVLSVRTVVPEDSEKTAENVLKDMLLSIKPYFEDTEYSDMELNGINVKLPTCFEKTKINDQVMLAASDSSLSPFSGMKLAALDMTLNLSNLDKTHYMNSVSPKIGEMFLPGEMHYKVIGSYIDDPVPVVLSGRNAYFICDTLSFAAKPETRTAFTAQGLSGNALYFMYLIPKEANEYKAVVLFSPFYLAENAAALSDVIIDTLTY